MTSRILATNTERSLEEIVMLSISNYVFSYDGFELGMLPTKSAHQVMFSESFGFSLTRFFAETAMQGQQFNGLFAGLPI